MEYLLLIHSDPNGMKDLPEDKRNAALAAYRAYTNAIRESGVLLSVNRLRPGSASTTVRVRDGKTDVLDGPYADTKEQLAGYYLIEAPDLDAAIAWAARCPGAGTGTLEVRPIWEMEM